MHRSKISWTIALCLPLALSDGTASGGTDEAARLLRLMPVDFPIAVVVVDFEKLDKSVSSVTKRLKPGSTEPGMLSELKSELGVVGEWIDFSKPIGLAGKTLQSDEDGLLWLRAPDFSAKAKKMETASQEDDVWLIPFGEAKNVFVRVRGDYIIVAKSKEMLAKAVSDGRNLGDELKPRLDLLRSRDALIHVNIEPVRQAALGGIANFAQMAPMVAMMAGPQGGDPAAITAFFTTVAEAGKKFVEQVSYVDLAIAVGDQAGDLTVTTGYKAGPIKDYLARQKPAGLPAFADVPEQPYMLAFNLQVPGDEFPFVDYFCEQMMNAAAPAPVTGEGKGQSEAHHTGELKDAIRAARELYRGFDGFNVVMAMSPGGMQAVGDYLTKEPDKLLELVRESLITANPLMQQFGGGVSYESLGPKEIGAVQTERFAMKVDSAQPGAEKLKAMYGADPRFALGITGGRLRYCMGSDEHVERTFTAKAAKPFTSNRYVQDALAKLPPKRNMVALVDLAAVISAFAPLLNMPEMGPIPPGPPIAVAVSLVGDPARVDIHVPWRAIERVVQATAPEEPM